ncbi:MAG: HIT domain-containing protein [Proteobacteria bacterium]|nr:HIT domain-containing protein [Pseudomonadota bacterium]
MTNTIQYDENNVFAKIIRGEIPCSMVYEDDYVVAFHDINPSAPVHILVAPKGRYVSFDDFIQHAPGDFVIRFFKAIRHVANTQNLCESGYRIISNHGKDAFQTVHHFHVHILGKCAMGSHVGEKTLRCSL